MSSEWNGNQPAQDGDVGRLRISFPLPLPESFIDFLRSFNGGSGSLGPDHGQVHIMSTQEIVHYQAVWRVQEHLPGMVLFGADGDFGLLFDTSQAPNKFPVMICPLSSLSVADAEGYCESFEEVFYRAML